MTTRNPKKSGGSGVKSSVGREGAVEVAGERLEEHVDPKRAIPVPAFEPQKTA